MTEPDRSATALGHPADGGPGCLDAFVAGDASIDTSWQVSSVPTPGRTSTLRGSVVPELTFGGCGPQVALALARLGLRVALSTWLGDDAPGRRYLAELEAAGVDVGPVVIAPGQDSPRSVLLYDPSGAATCLHHPSGSLELRLTDAGRAALERSGWVVLTAGPRELTESVLDTRPSGSHLAWDVKADPKHYPIELRRRIITEADVVIFNSDEAAFIGEAYSLQAASATGLRTVTRAILVETSGDEGSLVTWPGGMERVPAEAVKAENPTGVGDAFFAAFVASTIRGAAPGEAAHAATRHAATFLRRRAGIHRTDESDEDGEIDAPSADSGGAPTASPPRDRTRPGGVA